MEQFSVFEKNYRNYLSQIAGLDFNIIAEKLGADVHGDEIIVPFFKKPHSISSRGVYAPDQTRPIYSICIVLCKYLLLCPDTDPQGDEWVSYKDFKDATPFAQGFINNAEKPIVRNFATKLQALKFACTALGGQPSDSVFAYDLKMIFHPLPKVPLFLLFNDADEEFLAQSAVLFERRAEKYLDMECLAILGWLLADYLHQAIGGTTMTIM